LASGTCGYGAELDGRIDWKSVGAIFTKGLSLSPRRGHPPPRICEVSGGMLNAIGLENIGVDAFIRDKMPFLRDYRETTNGAVVANLYGTGPAQYGELASRLNEVDGVDGVEINLSCPNVAAGGIEFGRTVSGCAAVTRAVRDKTSKLVVVKLSPASPVGEIARAAVDAGADALSLCNTMPAMSIDVESRMPRLSNGVGGLSGPALRPIAVKAVYEAAKAVSIPIVGIGGVQSGRDAMEFILAGASAVQIGTATFADPNVATAVLAGIGELMDRYGVKNLRELVGTVGEMK